MLKFKVHSDESYEHVPVLDEIPIHIYKNLIKGAYYRSEKYVKDHQREKGNLKNFGLGRRFKCSKV